MKNLPGLFILLLILFNAKVSAQEYTLSIQPMLPKDTVEKSYQPLASYLSKHTGHKITVKAYRNFFTYWQKMKNTKNFDLVLDAAHFTDYRVQKKNYTILAKIPETVSYSIVTHEDVLILDTDELVLEKIATTTSPGLGGIRLYEIFKNPTRLPVQVTVNNSIEAIDAVVEGKAMAAIIPTPLVTRYDYLNTVTTTKSIPHMALSASPNVPEVVKRDIQRALINAYKSKDGKQMLARLKLEKFISTSAKDYDGYAGLLKDLFGYDSPDMQLIQQGL